jgi:hypothetical protein
MAKQSENHPKRGSDHTKGGEPLKRRGDNVGQSGRWTKGDPASDRYGHEERWHSSEHPAGAPDEPLHPAPGDDKPAASPYQGRFAPPGEAGEEHGDDKADHPAGSYAEAGGTAGSDRPTHPGDGRWEDEGGAGHGEQYGSGREPADKGAKPPAPRRRPG